jgi:aerobic-type carbon monoxide dehydrogenase small subunit (CoxS/CutS family)
MAQLRLNVNGKTLATDAPQPTTLLTLLRDFLHITGPKFGCGEGVCGACTVLIDGKPVRSCIVKAASVAGKRITTIEGLADGDRLHPLQQAFLDVEAFQCGFCTPGMIVASAALLAANKAPTATQIREHLQGHLCRCGTYPRIVEAVQLASKSNGKGARHA